MKLKSGLIFLLCLCLFIYPVVRAENSELSISELLSLVDVDEIELDFNKKVEYKGHLLEDNFLWDSLDHIPQLSKFQQISTEDWFNKWAQFKEKILRLARQNEFDVKSLKKCLEKIEPRANNKNAFVPVAAFLAKKGDDAVWVIVGVWERAILKFADGREEFGSLGHVCIWAVLAKSQEIINFVTCD